MTQETDDFFTFVQIPENWEPADGEGRHERALFLYHAVDGHIRLNLFRLIAKCKDGTLDKETQQGVRHNLNEWAVAAAIKEATCICIHRSFLEQGGEEVAGWLLDFVLLSYQEADAVCAQPDSADIIEKYEQIPVSDLIPVLIARLGKSFGIPARSEAQVLLQNLLESSAGIASELLLLSITQPLDSLSRHLQMYQQ